VQQNRKCGFVSILGRPNVGKSSLLNAILKKKVSIISYKPQTTRQQILGVKTDDLVQTVYVDTPGIHLGAKKALNKHMNKTAHQSLLDVNAVVFVVEALKWTLEDEHVRDIIQELSCPVVIALNKVDLVPEKERLLAFIGMLNEKCPKAVIIPLSAKKGSQIEALETELKSYLPPSERRL
jgi:GTPase